MSRSHYRGGHRIACRPNLWHRSSVLDNDAAISDRKSLDETSVERLLLRQRLLALDCRQCDLGIVGEAGFYRVRLDMSDSDSRQSSPRSGRKSTQRTVQICQATSARDAAGLLKSTACSAGARQYSRPPRQTTTSPRQPLWDSCISVQPAFLKPRSAGHMNAVGTQSYTLRATPNTKSAPT
jgi:hypothetical protein